MNTIISKIGVICYFFVLPLYRVKALKYIDRVQASECQWERSWTQLIVTMKKGFIRSTSICQLRHFILIGLNRFCKLSHFRFIPEIESASEYEIFMGIRLLGSVVKDLFYNSVIFSTPKK